MADEIQIENDVLEFDDDVLPELPDDNPFEDAHARRPWLLIGIGVVTVAMVVAIVLKLTVGRDTSDNVIEIPVETVGATTEQQANDFAAQANKIVAVDESQKAGKVQDMPERDIAARKPVVFDPDKPIVQRPKPRPIADVPESGKDRAPQQSSQKVREVVNSKSKMPATSGVWKVQVGSYNSRNSAEAAKRKMIANHKSLFEGRDFVVLSAVLPNGSTTYRLRVVGFSTSSDAAGFCRNAQSDGISCYVAK